MMESARPLRVTSAPPLSLADGGAYALVLVGLDSATPTLMTLGLVEDGKPCAVRRRGADGAAGTVQRRGNERARLQESLVKPSLVLM